MYYVRIYYDYTMSFICASVLKSLKMQAWYLPCGFDNYCIYFIVFIPAASNSTSLDCRLMLRMFKCILSSNSFWYLYINIKRVPATFTTRKQLGRQHVMYTVQGHVLYSNPHFFVSTTISNIPRHNRGTPCLHGVGLNSLSLYTDYTMYAMRTRL